MHLLRLAIRLTLRDLRGSPSLFLFAILISVGLAMFIAVRGTVNSLQIHIDGTAQEILGGDITVSGREPIPAVDVGVPGFKLVQEIRTRTMASSADASILVQVRGIDPEYPLYGVPLNIAGSTESIRDNAVVEPGLLERLHIQPGEKITVFGKSITVAGELQDAPGELSISSVVAPRLYVPRSFIPPEVISAKGSLFDYSIIIGIPAEHSVELVAETLRNQVDQSRFEVMTYRERAAKISGSIDNVGALASSVALASTLLALLGAAIALRAYLRSKQITVALLDCLGARKRFVGTVYVLQIAALGTISGLLSILGAISVHLILLKTAEMLTPVNLQWGIGFSLLLQAIFYGLLLTLWVAWQSIVVLMETSGLNILRSLVTPYRPSRIRVLLHGSSGLVLVTLLWISSGSTKSAGILLVSTIIAVGGIGLVVMLLKFLLKRFSERVSDSISRLAFRNLVRPTNQSGPILISITLAIALSVGLSIVERTIDQTRAIGSNEDSANMFLYQLDPEQVPRAQELVQDFGGKIVQQVPVVLMRIKSVKGKEVRQILTSSPQAERWPLTREYWSSYRSQMQTNERLLQGRWIASVKPGKGPIGISLDQRMADRIGVELGDPIEWDIQGVVIKSYVANLREIMWEKFERNSFVVFPEGVLESATQFLFWSMHVGDAKNRALLIQSLTRELPNVSALDLNYTIRQVLVLLDRVGAALKILFSLVAVVAFALLVTVTFSSRVDRKDELSMLRAIGMRSTQLRSMIRREFYTLGFLALVLGSLFGLMIGWGIATFALRLTMIISWWFIAGAWIAVLGVCGLAGRMVEPRAI